MGKKVDFGTKAGCYEVIAIRSPQNFWFVGCRMCGNELRKRYLSEDTKCGKCGWMWKGTIKDSDTNIGIVRLRRGGEIAKIS